MSRANNDTYTRFAIIMHWSSVFLILLNLSIGLYMDTFPHNSPRSNGILFYHVYSGGSACRCDVQPGRLGATERL